MINITDKAIEAYNIKTQGNRNLIIRLDVSSCGWAGSSYKVVLDEHHYPNDIMIELNGIKVVYNKSLSQHFRNIIIDYSNFWMFSGFYLRN